MSNNTSEGPSADTLDSAVNTDTVLAICYYVMGGIGIIGNLLVVIVMLNTKTIRTKVSGMYVINLAIVDTMTAIMLVLTNTVSDEDRVYRTWADDIFCRFWPLKIPLWLFIHTSTWSLVAVTMERYLAIVHPIKHKLAFTRGKAIAVLSLAWIIPWSYLLANFLAISRVENGKCVNYVFKTASGRRASGVMLALLNYFIPLFILTFCYTRMIMALRQRVAPAQHAQVDNSTARSNHRAMARRNVIKTLIIVCLGFILCSSWMQWFFFLFNIGVFDYDTFNRNLQYRLISTAFTFVNCCINPFIYTVYYRAFQDGMKKMFCPWYARRIIPVDPTMSSTTGP